MQCYDFVVDLTFNKDFILFYFIIVRRFKISNKHFVAHIDKINNKQTKERNQIEMEILT